jgi:hypothetical protein
MEITFSLPGIFIEKREIVRSGKRRTHKPWWRCILMSKYFKNLTFAVFI